MRSAGLPESPFINEGPFGLAFAGAYYLFYSASGSWCEDYCIAVLKLVGGDPLRRDHWQKCRRPLLRANELVKGAGHCSLLCEDQVCSIFFHAWDKQQTQIRWDTVCLWRGRLEESQNPEDEFGIKIV